jgi:subtilisin family serine protease
MTRIHRFTALLSLALVLHTSPAFAATVDPLLRQRAQASPLALTPVVITYNRAPGSAELLALRTLGIRGGVVLGQLPMVLTAVTAGQLDRLAATPGIASLYANRTMKLLTNVSRSFIGVAALQGDLEVSARNGGLPVSGRRVGVAYVDTGIDATHPDLQLGRNVTQNVLFPLAEVPLNLPGDFVPVVALENNPMTDVEGGHGTFGAAIVAGTGQVSGTFYGGVAPGAGLVGLVAGNDAGLSSFAILQSFDYALANQFKYNIRVCNNSWGTTLADTPYDPLDPINVATRSLHDRNIVVVFAAGNDGDIPGAINPYSVAPWVISVAAGEKQGFGAPAGFSSRGVDNGTGADVAGQPADPSLPPNLRPDVTAPGADIKSARSKGPGLTNLAGTLPIFVGANDLTTIPPAFLPFYTTSQGTSFAAPHVSGVVALMIEANPALTPDEVVTILRGTATPMPYEPRIVGAGYVDAHNAVRTAMGLAAVAHPADLFPPPNGPEIADPSDDQLGTTAQDLRSGDFTYDPAQRQIVYRLTLADLSQVTPNARWTMSSAFGATTVFVTASIPESGAPAFTYGTITTLATGTRNQQNLGAADSGDMTGNTITIRLALDKVNAAVGSDVLYATSTATAAQAQILVGTSATGGLLLSSDAASGSDFKVGEPPPPAAAPSGSTGLRNFKEHFVGTVSPNHSSDDFTVDVRGSSVDADVSYHPRKDQAVTVQLIDSTGRLWGSTSDSTRLRATGLAPGRYTLRVGGALTQPVDFVVKVDQKR